MGQAPITRPSLLVRMRDARDGAAWGQFVDIYGPLIYGHARKCGLQDADAADVTQDVLRAVASSMDGLSYDPRRGSFRGWLFTIVRNVERNFLVKRQRHPAATGADGLLAAQPARDEELDRQWNLEYEKRLFVCAARQVRAEVKETTWQAFWQTAVEARSFQQTAEALNMSVGAVYMAKSRVLQRLREQIHLLEEQ